MKKSLLMLLPLLAITLAGCNENTSDASTSTKTTTTVNYGTVDNPLTVADFREEAAKLDLTNEAFSLKTFFVKGIIKSVPSTGSSYYFRLADSKTDTSYVNVGGAVLSSSVTAIYQNDTIVIEGLAECYEGYYSIYTNDDIKPTIHSSTLGTSEVSSDADSTKATVSGYKDSYTNGETASFIVEPKTGYKVINVSTSLNGSLQEKDGEYSFTVLGDTVISVTTLDSGLETKSVVLDFASLYETNKSDLTSTIANEGNITEVTWGGMKLNAKYSYLSKYQGNSYLMLSNKGANFFASNETFGRIYFVKVTIGNGASSSAEYQLSMLNEANKEAITDEAVNKKAGETIVYEAKDGESFSHFSVSCKTENNGRLGKIEVVYIVE